MKLLLLFVAFSSFCHATTILFGLSPGTSIVDSAGNLITSSDGAIVEAGLIDSASLFESLVGVSGTNSGTIGIAGTSVFDGLLFGSTANNTGEADAFNGESVAVQIFLNATEFVVVTTSVVFPTNGNGLGDSANLVFEDITGIVASLSSAGSSLENGVLTIGSGVAVPEPSAVLLAGLALVGGLARRRR